MASTPNLSIRVEHILARARKAADKLGQAYVNSEHLVLGLLEEGKGAAQTLADLCNQTVPDLEAAFKTHMVATAQPVAGTAAQSAPVVRYYLVVDDTGIGCFTWLAKVHDHRDHTGNKATELLDVPFPGGQYAYVDNLFARDPLNDLLRCGQGGPWMAWSISPFEYQRVKDLIDLWPSVEKARKLGGAA